MSDPSPSVLNGRYRLESVVGEGGMAVVWRATDLLLGRIVAVKVLREQFATDPEFVARFESEARSAAALNDPGVVTVYDVGSDDGRPYLVMEYVAGRDLKALIRAEAPLAPQRAVGIAASLARAVEAAHRIGLVHRDVKPQNVLVCEDGRMKVADFGIARAAAAARVTAPGLVLGTVHYVAPEQAAGGSASTASDVYSLGVVLYELLTGHVPFDADSSVAVAMRIVQEDPVPVERENPRVPPALAGIVARAMARQPEARYADAGELADALDAFAERSRQVTAGVAPVRRPEAPPVRQTRPRPVADGPLIDRTGVLLALVALIALAGLIPLWVAVLARADSGADPHVPLLTRATEAKPTGAAAPTVDPTEAVSGLLVPVPNVVGEEVDRAKSSLLALGLSATEGREYSDTVAAGRVIRQQPAPSENVPQGSVVQLAVSQGVAITVPAASGDYGSVAAALLAAGFEPVRVDKWTGAGGQVETVLGIDPAPGTVWPRGSPVQVAVDSGSWLWLGVDFEDSVHLRGIDLPRSAVAPGDMLTFVAFWEAVAPITGDYVARASLVDETGSRLVEVELPLADRPSSTWEPGERTTSSRFDLALGQEAPPGAASLSLELLEPGDPPRSLGVRSRGLAARLEGSRLVLASIEVAAP